MAALRNRRDRRGARLSGAGPVHKVFIFLKRRPGMSTEAFRDYYENHHRPLMEPYLRGLAGYVRNYLNPLPHLDSKAEVEIGYEARILVATG